MFVLVLSFIGSSVQACRSLIQPDENAQKRIDEAYFVGLVRGIYFQQFENGRFKEAGLKPFMVYASSKDIDFSKLIVVSGNGSWTSCDADVPYKGDLEEVMVIKKEGQLVLTRIDFTTPEFIEKMRQKARYVGVE